MHVAVLGAGYAGLTLTRLLEQKLPDDVEITLVDESPDHLVQHELHRVIRRPALAAEITISLPNVLERASVHVARVEEIDRETRTVTLSNGSLSYDVASICLGTETAFYGLRGVREHATPLKRLVHARRIRSDFFAAIEANGQGSTSRDATADPVRIVVGGAGLSGVQAAGEIAALADEERADVSITLLEQYDSVAPGFPARFQRAVRTALEERDVDVRTGTTVIGADESAIHLDGDRRLVYDQLIWTGGIRGPNALDGERPTVRSDLRLDDRTFGCGDAVQVIDTNGQSVPASAQSAVREARTVARNVTKIVDRELAEPTDDHTLEPRLAQFTFESPGWLVSVGDDAVAQIGPAVVTGRVAKLVKTTVGVGYLSSIGGLGNAADFAYEEFCHERSH